MNIEQRILELGAKLEAIAERKARDGALMLWPAYRELEREEAELRAEYLRLLDGAG
jgi:hypothetical protein